jgi:hypothetical protein
MDTSCDVCDHGRESTSTSDGRVRRVSDCGEDADVLTVQGGQVLQRGVPAHSVEGPQGNVRHGSNFVACCACLKHALLHAGPLTAVSDADRNEGCMATALLAKPHSRPPLVAKAHTPWPFVCQDLSRLLELGCSMYAWPRLTEVYPRLGVWPCTLGHNMVQQGTAYWPLHPGKCLQKLEVMS